MCNEQPLKGQKKNRSFRYTEYNWMHPDVSLVGNSTKFSERCCISELREGAEMWYTQQELRAGENLIMIIMMIVMIITITITIIYKKIKVLIIEWWKIWSSVINISHWSNCSRVLSFFLLHNDWQRACQFIPNNWPVENLI